MIQYKRPSLKWSKKKLKTKWIFEICIEATCWCVTGSEIQHQDIKWQLSLSFELSCSLSLSFSFTLSISLYQFFSLSLSLSLSLSICLSVCLSVFLSGCASIFSEVVKSDSMIKLIKVTPIKNAFSCISHAYNLFIQVLLSLPFFLALLYPKYLKWFHSMILSIFFH